MKYTAVVIGADYDDYLVIVVLNEWKNKFITGMLFVCVYNPLICTI